MFNLTGSEIIVILLLALVVLGPEKLPDAIRRFGRTYGEFKRMSAGFQSEFRSALDEPVREMRDTAEMLGRVTDFRAADIVDPSRPDGGPASPAPDAGTPAATEAVDRAPTDRASDEGEAAGGDGPGRPGPDTGSVDHQDRDPA